MRKPSLASIRKKQKKALEKECMFLWQYIVKKRAEFKCELTGQAMELQAHHIWHKGNYPILRYNPDNGVCLSRGQHFKAHNCGEAELVGFLIKKRGQEWFDRLTELTHNQGYKYTVELLEGIKAGLEALK